MKGLPFLCCAIAGLVLAAAPQQNQPPKNDTLPEVLAASLTVRVSGKPDLTLYADDLAKMPRHDITVTEHGKQVQYEGVLLRDVLARAGAPLGPQLRGKALSNYVLATARDGYAVVYTLTEMDTAFSDGDLLIADKNRDGPLSAEQGPLRIIVPHDKKPARWLRMLKQIDVEPLRK